MACKESICKCRRCRFHPWVRKIPWERKWQPTPVFLPGKSQGERNLAGRLQSMGSQRVRHDWRTEHAYAPFTLHWNTSWAKFSIFPRWVTWPDYRLAASLSTSVHYTVYQSLFYESTNLATFPSPHTYYSMLLQQFPERPPDSLANGPLPLRRCNILLPH